MYQYAVGLTAAEKIAADILDGKPGALENYMALLRAGEVEDVTEALAKLGVDITSREIFDGCVKEFEAILDEYETAVSTAMLE